jgi:hypothetical protein
MNEMNHATGDGRQPATGATPVPPGAPAPPIPPSDAAIRYVTFIRRLPDGRVQRAIFDLPVEEIATWEQVVDLWGGGEYQAIAKDANHRVIRHYPGRRRWMSFTGEPKPMDVRPRRPADDPRAPVLSAAHPQRQPEPPPVALSSDGNVVSVNGRILRVYVFRERPCVVAEDLMRVLAYDGTTLTTFVRLVCRWLPHVGEVLTDLDLQEFKRAMEVVRGAPVEAGADLFVLYDRGINCFCEAAQNGQLGCYLIHEVIPKLGGSRRALTAPAAPAPEPVAPPARKFKRALTTRVEESDRRIGTIEARVAGLELWTGVPAMPSERGDQEAGRGGQQ